MYFAKNIANAVSLDLYFVNVYFFYIHGDNGSGILNVIEEKKHLNTIQNHWVVQIRLHILAFSLLRTTASFIKDHPVFLVGSGPIERQNETWGAIGPPCGANEPPPAEASMCLDTDFTPDIKRLQQLVVLLHDKGV